MKTVMKTNKPYGETADKLADFREPFVESIEDLFDPALPMLDLTVESAGVGFNLVDGTVAVAIDPNKPWILYKGHNQDTWFYAPRWGRLSKKQDGTPIFSITRKRKRNPNGSSDTVGGVLSFMFELALELPDAATIDSWHALIKTLYAITPTVTGRFTFQPLPLYNGELNVFGLDRYALPGQILKDIEVGASSSVAFAIELNAEGADNFFTQVGTAGIAPQVSIVCDFKYQYIIPTCSIRLFGNQLKTYEYFSQNIRARASYFGLFGGSFDKQDVRAQLRTIGGMQVDIVGTPPAGFDLQKLLDAFFERFIKQEVGQWIVPDATPVQAPNPEGFFGGASYAMKKVNLSSSAEFTGTFNFSSIKEEIHKVSFNFEQAAGELTPAGHAFTIEDDLKIPFDVVISACEFLQRFVVSAAYVTQIGPISVQIDSGGAEGGGGQGIIQFPVNSPPPRSAQVECIFDFKPPFSFGYIHKETKPITETGAAFSFSPNLSIQRTDVTFIFESANAANRAVFEWKWRPPQGSPRRPVSGYSMIAPDPNGNSLNLPSAQIIFPYHPDDWRPNDAKISYKVQGIGGAWKNKTAQGTIDLGAPVIIVDWDKAISVNSFLMLPPDTQVQNNTDKIFKVAEY